MDYLVNLFHKYIFNQSKVPSMDNTYLVKYVRDTYRVNLQDKLTYEHPLVINDKEWKDSMDDEKEK